ncbi:MULTISPECIES: AEC family transporter [Curvibacter]|jgi:predicted permease|uniref:AEC family transporter n=1 Tax=Curvibacter TaxID=281915 RepID=UPI0003797D30|nr:MULTISPECIES: AEC family transporter [Curvibacter]MBV5291957.1 AEC family transporter [Curvibacter lanceolatus]
MLDILAITGPIYIAIALGFLTTRAGLFSKPDMRVFGKFVINLALPAMLFNALAKHPIGEILNTSYLLAYLAGSLLTLGLGYTAYRRLAHTPALQSTCYAMGLSCSNSGFVGFPILVLTLAPVAGVALALNMVVENVVMIPLLLAMAERARGHATGWRHLLVDTSRRLITNPMVIGLLLGFGVSLSGLHLPTALERSVGLFAQASGALSLFVIGGTLTGLSFGGLLRRVAPIVAGKLLLHPLAVLAAVSALPLIGLAPLAPQLKLAAVLSAAMPMMGIYTILAQAYGEEDTAAASLLAGTVASFFTVSGLLMALHTV